MIALAKTIKRLIPLETVPNNNEILILQQPYSINAANAFISTPLNPITNVNGLDERILEWKRKESKIISLKRVINTFTFMHIVDILQLYEAVKENKDQIQSISKYKPKKYINTKGWITKYLAEKLEYSSRQVTRYLTAARRLKNLFDRGITYDILVSSKCSLSDFWCSEKIYQKFLDEFENV
jgi:ribosomal protein S17E